MSCHHLKLIIFLWKLVNLSGIVSEKTCALNDLFACPEGESCKQVKNSSSLGICECKNKFKRNYPGGACIEQTDSNITPLPNNPESVYSPTVSVSVIAGVLIIVLSVVVIGAALIYAAKKYRWLHRVREKAQQYRASHYDTVLVNQEDDPPLT